MLHEDIKTITTTEGDFRLSKLDRHILYALDEHKGISPKYPAAEVVTAILGLNALGLVKYGYEGSSLTFTGVLAMNACRISSLTGNTSIATEDD